MQKASDDEVRGRGPIKEEEVVVLKSCILKPPAIIQRPVQTNHGRYVILAKV